MRVVAELKHSTSAFTFKPFFICIILCSIGPIVFAEPFYGYHYDSAHPDMNDLGYPAWAILSVYGAPSQDYPGPSPANGQDFYQFCLAHSLIPVFRLEEAWWLAHGMYMEHFPADGRLEVALGDKVQLVGVPRGNYTWSSSDESVGTVDSQGMFLALSEGICRVVAVDGIGSTGFSAELSVLPIVIRARDVILKGATATFYSSGPNQPHSWSVDDTNIASIDPISGDFTGLAAGTVTVRAADTAGTVQTCTVKIVDAWIRGARPGFNMKMSPGEVLTLIIEGQYSGQIIWHFNSDVLRLDDQKGIFTALAPGNSTVWFETDAGHLSNIMEISVTEIVIQAPWKQETVPGDSIQFSARREGASGFIWHVDNPEIGTVDQTGKFTAIAAGICHVIATTELISVTSDPITVSNVMVVAEYWSFFDQWVASWARRYPEAWFQYGNEVGSAVDPYQTSFSNIKEGYVIATRHVHDMLHAFHPDPHLIAQGACSVSVFEQMIDYGLDSYVDAYALHTYLVRREMNDCSIPSGDSFLFMDPDIWHDTLMTCPGVTPEKPWFVTETSTQFNSDNVKAIEALPTWFAYFRHYRSSLDQPFKAALWFTLDSLINPPATSPDEPMEGYEKLEEFLQKSNAPPPADVIMLDLSDYVNIDGFASSAQPDEGNLDGAGNSFNADLLPGAGTLETLVDRIPWHAPDVSEGQDNIVECRGQFLDIPLCLATEVHVIACGAPEAGNRDDYGDIHGTFSVLFSDFSFDQQSVNISHWTGGPKFGEYPALIMRHYLSPAGPAELYDLNHNLVRDYNAFVWDYPIAVSMNKPLSGIFLPNNPDIKILAVSIVGESLELPGITVFTNHDQYSTGDDFVLSAVAVSEGQFENGTAYILLDIEGTYWCWPEWASASEGICGSEIRFDESGTWVADILTFTWPELSTDLDPIHFWAGLTDNSGMFLDFGFCSVSFQAD